MTTTMNDTGSVSDSVPGPSAGTSASGNERARVAAGSSHVGLGTSESHPAQANPAPAPPTVTDTDLLIVGGGPAGLAAAVQYARTLRPFVLYDSGSYRNAPATAMQTVPGYRGRAPDEWRADVRRDVRGAVAAYGLHGVGGGVTAGGTQEAEDDGNGGGGGNNGEGSSLRNGRVMGIKRVCGGSVLDPPERTMFEAVDERGGVVRARKVILATGVRDVLPDIPGLADHWGSRAIHCLFCHGTETGTSRIGFLLSRASAASNAGLVSAMLTMWAGVPHAARYVLTNGLDPGADGPDVSGLRAYLAVIKARGFEIITAPILRIETTTEGDPLVLFAEGRSHDPAPSPLALPYLMLSPKTLEPSPHARELLTPALLGHHAPLGPMGALPGPPLGAPPPHMPYRAGADPRTGVRGLFWAGNAGAPHANVSMSVAQGQIAAIAAADEAAREDLESELGGTRGW